MHAAATSDPARRILSIEGLRSELAGPFDLEAESGNSIIITGASGSGKSLFLRMIADLDLNEGSVSLDGRERRAMSASNWRSLVTYVAAESGWWLDNVGQHFQTQSERDLRSFAEALSVSPDQLRAPINQLSSGERQRWALIRAAVKQPQVLLLDEPTGALDQLSVERVEGFLARLLERGTILVMVTHDLVLAERIGGRRFEMVDRQLRPL